MRCSSVCAAKINHGNLIAEARNSVGTIPSFEGIRKSPVPHLRHAHWHGYRVGKGRKDFKLRWLPPIAVNVPETDPPSENGSADLPQKETDG
jgi:hypothetical protein